MAEDVRIVVAIDGCVNAPLVMHPVSKSIVTQITEMCEWNGNTDEVKLIMSPTRIHGDGIIYSVKQGYMTAKANSVGFKPSVTLVNPS